MLQVPQVGSSVGEDRPQQLGINAHRAHSWHSDTTGGRTQFRRNLPQPDDNHSTYEKT